MALPALADLRRHHADDTMHVAARASVAPLYTMVPHVDGVLTLTSRGGWSPRRWRTDALTLSAGRYDAAYLFPNSFASALVARASLIPARVGFASDARSWLLTRAVAKPRAGTHQAEYYQHLIARAVGAPAGPRFACVVAGAAARARAEAQLQTAGISRGQRFVVLAPGAAYGTAKQWLPERFAELARLLENADRSSVLVGSAADARVCARISSLAPGVVDLSGQTDLATLAGVLALAEVCVSNDSGAMHLAGAVGTRVIALFGPTDERRTSPLTAGANAAGHRIASTPVFCRPCMLRECPIDHRCMTRISAAHVATLVREQED